MARVKKIPVIDYDNCAACGICMEDCPFSCLDMTYKHEPDIYNNRFPELVKKERCIGCSLCAKACPIEIITMKEIGE